MSHLVHMSRQEDEEDEEDNLFRDEDILKQHQRQSAELNTPECPHPSLPVLLPKSAPHSTLSHCECVCACASQLINRHIDQLRDKWERPNYSPLKSSWTHNKHKLTTINCCFVKCHETTTQKQNYRCTVMSGLRSK